MSDSFDRVEALQASPLFNDLLPLEKQYLADLAVQRNLRSGDVLFEAGDLGAPFGCAGIEQRVDFVPA